MKKFLCAILFISLCNCASDDADTSFDLNELYGQWYEVGLCQSQNSLLLNSDASYVLFSSGATDCDDPAPDTYRFSGSYSISGNLIVYNQQTANLVIDGTDLTNLEFPNPEIQREIMTLNTNNLVIEVYIQNGNIREIIRTINYER